LRWRNNSCSSFRNSCKRSVLQFNLNSKFFKEIKFYVDLERQYSTRYSLVQFISQTKASWWFVIHLLFFLFYKDIWAWVAIWFSKSLTSKFWTKCRFSRKLLWMSCFWRLFCFHAYVIQIWQVWNHLTWKQH
jgi:hypothetical protein